MTDGENLPIQMPEGDADETRHRRQRMARLLDRLPDWLRRATIWLLRPHARWIRIPAGLLLVLGGIFSILPILGIWMLPLGLILLAEDVPLLRRWRERALDWIEHNRPHWIYGKDDASSKVDKSNDRA
ncbi:MAG TPA: DUF2892 domain-containing protein [Acidisoma sp.]|uniref:YgaP family membrane protein n=1 Tax=Acidisoma sp. TaxID=1872115 RepID=UPI002B8F9F77|nr:DUF2892 domain-containing protein [Acidisoma sp.]HTI02051.1 DUF2892 domain-containing protein [Acidisoma sp.]